MSPLAMVAEIAPEKLREMRTAGAHHAANHVCVDLGAVRTAIIAFALDAATASAPTPQPFK
jgi:hypothetical protein